MRALCTVRGPLPAVAAVGAAAETRGALPAGARLVALRAPGLSHPLHFVVEAKSRVRDLRARAHRHFQLEGIADTELFGFAIFTNGEYLFVDLDSKLSKYAPKSWRSSHTHGLDANGRPLLELHLTVQFYVESPLLLSDDTARRLYFLQLRANVVSRDVLPPERLLPLAGLALQAEYGDADQYADRDYFRLADFAPRSLAGDWVAAAARACHREHRGLARAAAETRFIREVSLLPHAIDAHRYTMKRNKNEPEPGGALLLVTARGIKLADDDVLPHRATFPWSSIGKLSFDRKKFEIRTREGNVTLYSTSEDKAKCLFALCRETHQFSLKIAAELSDVLRAEEEERRGCFGYSDTLSECDKKKSEQRVSVISSASSNTTSGIVSDRVHSEDELEIMINSPPAVSTESLALAHLLDSAMGGRCDETVIQAQDKQSPDSTNKQIEEPESRSLEQQRDSPISNKLKCAGSQCSSSCSTVVISRAGLNPRRSSNASSLELGFSHTAQNSIVSELSTVRDVEYARENTCALYDGAITVAASSETSGVYTMGGSEMTATRKTDTVSEASHTECGSSHYSFEMSQELIRFDSISSIVDSVIAERKSPTSDRSMFQLPTVCNTSAPDCVDGEVVFREKDAFRQRSSSTASAVSFHGDGSDPTDGKRTLLSASELSDLIVGRGAYPVRQSVSDTLDSVSDYVRLPLTGDSYLPGHEDTAPSDDSYRDAFFERPPTPPSRVDSRKLNLSLPNILDLDEMSLAGSAFPEKLPPPYEYHHKTFTRKLEPEVRYPNINESHSVHSDRVNPIKYHHEEIAARVVTSRPMITILKAEAGEVSSSIERTFAGPVSVEGRFQKQQKWRRPQLLPLEAKDSAPEAMLVTMLKLPPPPPPPRTSRLPPPPPPPPPPHLQQFHRQLYSDVDFVVYPLQDPLISQQNYLDSKLAGRHSSTLHYRSAPYLASPPSGSLYGSTQNLSDSYVQLPRPPTPPRERLACPDMRLRRVPPPPPPPYRHRTDSESECAIDIKTLREKSKNLDLPLIAALCNDRSLLKQTKAFGPGRTEECDVKRSVATDSIKFKCKQESTIKPSQPITQGKRILVRNPNDKLPEIPGDVLARPRALSNTYVAHPGATH